MEKVITIPKKLAKKDDLVVLEKSVLRKLTQENAELHSALEAILSGELAFKKGKTRSFRQFLKSRFPEYAKNL